MKLKHRLSIYSIIIFSIIILIISSFIYFSFYATMEKKEIKSLESKSLLAAIYYLEQDELSTVEHNHIKNQLQKTISRKNIAIYSKNDQKVNGEMTLDTNISNEFLQNIRKNQQYSIATDTFFYTGIFYKDNQGDFVVIAREPKDEFNDQMKSLLQILIIVSIIGLAFIYLFSNYLGYIAYEPINKIIEQIKSRNSNNFNEPLSLTNSYAEVDDLVKTYNLFIDQIAQTFHIQKNFIDYVSHELRTPITAILGTLEVTNQKSRSIEEHQATLNKLHQYTNDLQETLDQMMLLSGAKTNFELTSNRIDEIIWHVIENQIIYHQANINVELLVKSDQLLWVKGNDKLLDLAIGNIIENAIKYSNNQQINIKFLEENNQLIINIIDKGIGILPDDIEQITHNFYRGKNTSDFQGKGIGLSMANIIFKLHHIDLKIENNRPTGTIVCLTFNQF
jgi:two-component system, OmpR family, sensor histidine kinase ArlS